MTVKQEIKFADFPFWAQAAVNASYFTKEELDRLDDIFSTEYPKGFTLTEVNDLFWFEADLLAEELGFKDFEEVLKREKKG